MSEIKFCYFCLPYLLSRVRPRRIYVPAIKGTRPPSSTTKSQQRCDARPRGLFLGVSLMLVVHQACFLYQQGCLPGQTSVRFSEGHQWVIEPSGFQSVAHVHQMVCLGAARTNQRASPFSATVGQLPGRVSRAILTLVTTLHSGDSLNIFGFMMNLPPLCLFECDGEGN